MADAEPTQAPETHKKSSEDSQGPKKIVVCCDGTGNEFGHANSNVVKLYTALAIDNSQVGYYHPGVGTMEDASEHHVWARNWSLIKGLAFASGFKENVLDAYRYLMTIYNDGDQVFLFGFSRGAYTVRALAGLLDGYGLLCSGNEGHIPYAWRMYTDQLKNRDQHAMDLAPDSTAAAFKQTFSRKDFFIHFVGIWDTVSSVGWITTPLRLFNVARNPTIRVGRHAISIDERRCFYVDNLWGEPYPGQDIVQLWFAGAHSDVGGSYMQCESGLSNIALEWMIDQAKAAGVCLVKDRVELVLGRDSQTYTCCKDLYKGPFETFVHRSLNGWWLVLEYLPHLYYDKDLSDEVYRVPMGASRQLPAGALLHHSVRELMDDPAQDYRPRNVASGTLTRVPVTGMTASSEEPYRLMYQPAIGSEPPASATRIAFRRRALVALFLVLDAVVLLVIVVLLPCAAIVLLVWTAVQWAFGELKKWIPALRKRKQT
jgi:uncharacterized protein (DUF2235 family)